MAEFRYTGDEPRAVSILPTGTLRRVEPDEVFTVSDEVADSYECQPHFFERTDAPKESTPKPEKAAAKPKEGD